MALSKPYRLRQAREFSAVYRHGRKAVSAHFVVRALLAPPAPAAVTLAALPPSRLGISISQKVSKRAVVRNRIKRQIRAAIQQLLPGIKPGLLIVIGVRSDVSPCEYGETLRELEQIFLTLEVIHGHS